MNTQKKICVPTLPKFSDPLPEKHFFLFGLIKPNYYFIWTYYITFSTCRNTLIKFFPASFLKSSSVQFRRVSSANRCGYLETSSSPVVTLQDKNQNVQC